MAISAGLERGMKTISEICKETNVQQCHICEDLNCGDNMSNEKMLEALQGSMPIKMYGVEAQEYLNTEPEEVIETLIEDNCDFVGESLDAILGKITWPVKILVFERRKVCCEPGDVLERVLEEFDEEYGNPDGEYTEPTEKMKEAAKAFVEVVETEYISWQCNPTGETIEFTKEEAKKARE